MQRHPLLLLILSACVAETPPQTTADTTAGTGNAIVTVTPVNKCTNGMRVRICWLVSPDNKAVLVVANPVSVEADALPNAVFFGDEARGFQVQMDSVWDVAVSPDWKWFGFGRAYTVLHGEEPATNDMPEVEIGRA